MKRIITKAMVVLSLVFFAVSAKGQLPCATPGPLTLLELTPTTARVSLTTGVGDYNFGWFNVVVSTTPLADPRTATGSNIVYNGLVQSGFPLSGLTPNTKYYTYVQTNCETADNYNGFSAWVRDSITTPCAATTLPIQADFDEVAIPSCWRVAGANKPITNVIHYGTSGRSVRLQSIATADAYLISAPVNEAANNLEITLQAYGVSGSKFHVGILYDILNLTSIQEILPITVTENNTWVKYTVTTPANFTNTPNAYIVFYIPSGSAQTIYLDDIDIHKKPACPQPQGLEFSHVTNNSVVLKWTETGNATSWIVRYITSTGVSKTITANSNNPFILPTLLSSNEYTVSVAAACGGEFSMPVTFITPQTPAGIPYNTGFETGEDIDWTLVNGNQVNKWFIGSASGAFNTGSKALYISSLADGSVYKYDSVPAVASDPPVQSFVWAYRTFALQKISYTVSFNWKANGQGNLDLLRAFLVPDSVKFTAGDAKKMTGSVNTTPAGWIDIPTAGSGIGILNGKTTYQVVSSDIAIQNAGSYNLVFFWKNDNSKGGVPPAAIDNVSLAPTVCKQPQNVKAVNITQSSAQIIWTKGFENSWAVRVLQGDNIIWSNIITTNPTANVPNLQPSTEYTAQVRAICAVGDSSAWTVQKKFTTACALVHVPYYEYFDTYTDFGSSANAPTSYPNNQMPPCWKFLNKGTSSTAYPTAFISDYPDYVVLMRCLFFRASPVTPLFAVLPEFDQPIKNLSLSFVYRNQSTGVYDGILNIGVMTDPEDTATFVLLQSYPQKNVKTVLRHDFALDNLPPGARSIALKYVGGTGNGYYFGIDSLSVVKYTTCNKPQSFSISKTTQTTAEVVVKDSINTAWEASVVAPGAYPSENNVVSLTANNRTIPNLLPGTSYHVYLRANCGTSKSFWVGPVRLTTLCTTYTIPYLEPFDKYTQDISTSNASPATFPNCQQPSCWVFPVLSRNRVDYPRVFLSNYSTYAPGPGNYFFALGEPKNPVFAVLPEFNVPLDSLVLTFKYRHMSASYGNLFVGVMTDPLDTTTYRQVAILTPVATATKGTVDFNFSSFPAGTKYIAFKFTSTTNTYGVTIDSVNVTKAICPKTHFNIGSYTKTSVKLIVDDKANTQWEYSAVLSGSPITASGVISTNRNITIPNLSPATTYDIYIRANCGTATGTWVGPVKVTTLCNPVPIPLPYYSEDFEKYTSDIVTGGTPPTTYPKHTMPSCWAFPNLSANSLTYPQAFLSTNAGFPVAGKCLLFRNIKKSQSLFAVLPEFDKPTDSLVLSFTYRNSAVSAANGILQVGVMTAPMDTMTFYLVKELPQTATLSTVEVNFNYSGYLPAGAKNIAFKYIGGTADNMYLSIDNVTVKYTKCVIPQSMSINTILSDSANIQVKDEINSAWEFDIGTKGFSPGSTPVVNSTDRTAAFSNLSPNTYYDVYVRGVCNSIGKSEWRGPLTFKTECTAFNLTYTEDFEEGTNWTGTALDCWQMIGMSSDDVLTSDQKVHNSQSILLTNVTAISPRLNIAQLATCHVTGFAYSLMDSARFTIGVMTDPYNLSTYEPIKDVILTAKNQWLDFGTTFDTLYTSAMANLAASKYVVFYFPSSDPIYIDYVTIEKTPTCLKPSDIFVSNIMTNRADVSWKPNGSAKEWEVKVTQGNNLISSNIVTTDSTTVMNLTNNTEYTVQVRAICGAADSSEWTFPYEFTTACGIPTIPYLENFDKYVGLDVVKSTTAPATYPNNMLPPCWTFINKSTTNGAVPQAFLSSNANYTLGYGNYIFLKSSATIPLYAVLPFVDYPIANLIISFNYRNDVVSSYSGKLTVGVMSDPTDAATFKPLESYPITTVATSVKHNFSADILPPNAKYIAFEYAGNTNDNYGLALDNVLLQPNNCLVPINVKAVQITNNSAVANWEPTGSEKSWEIEVMQGTNVISSDTVTHNSYAINSLLAGSEYTVQVRAICGDGNSSVWSLPHKFMTMCAIKTLPWDEPFKNYSGSDIVAGTAPTTHPNNLMPSCWTFINRSANATDYPQAFLSNYSGYPVADNCLLFRASAIDPLYAVLPEFDAPMDSLVLKFTYRNNSVNATYGILQIGVMTDPSDPSTYFPISSLPQTTTLTTVEHYFYFDKLPPGARNIAFGYVNATAAGYYASIDDVSVKGRPSCVTPTYVTINNIKDTQADISWPAKGSVGWQVKVMQGTNVISLKVETSNATTIPNLLPSTAYTVQVRSICAVGDTSAWTTSYNFKTMCAPKTLPVPLEDFNSYSGADVMTSTTEPATYPNHLMPTCWSFIMSKVKGQMPEAYLSTYSGYASSGNCLFLKSSITTPLYAILPEYTTPIDSLTLSFSYRNFSVSAASGYLQVGVMTDPSDAATFILLKVLPQVGALTQVTDMDFNYSSLPAGVRNIAFRFVGGTSDNYYASIDNVQVKKGTCFKPHFTIGNITLNSADVLIDDNANTLWECSIVPSGSAPNASGIISISDSVYTIKDLKGLTSYDVYLRSNCGTQPGAWVGPVNFTTARIISNAPIPYFYGFEDVAENENWILNNGTQVNKWFIGNVDEAVKSGDYSLYISSMPEGSTYDYNITSTSYVYAYRTFNLKDTVYNISFDWKANGESTATNAYDLLRAFLVPASVTTLTAGNANGMTGYVNATPVDWIDVRTGTGSIGSLNQQSTWQTVNRDIKIAKAGLYNLVFFWKNDNQYGNQPPAAVDNIVLRKKNCINNINILDTISSSIPYYMKNGFNVPTDTLHTGVNTLSRTEFSAVDGVCDMKYNLQLYVAPPVQNIVSDVHCGTAPYFNYGFNIPTPATRTYSKMLYGESVLGTDSTVILNLTVQDLQPITIDTTVCDNKGYYFKGDTIKVSGAYVDSLKSIYGCDSIINLNLTVLPTRDTMQVTICAGKSYLFGDSTYKATGVYEQKGLFNVLGCDSTSVLDLTVRAEIVTDLYEAICQGDTLNKYGWSNLYKPGTYIDVKPSVFGCDSTINLTLDVNRKDTIPDFISVAVDKLPYDYYGFIIDNLSVGTYQYFVIVGSNIYHCDSTVNLTVKVTPPSGFDDLYSNSIKMYPNPIKVGSEETIDCNIQESDRQDIVVEVFNVIGEKIYSVRPNVYPIKVKAFDASGIYVVRIRGAKLHYEGKIVVKE